MIAAIILVVAIVHLVKSESKSVTKIEYMYDY